MFSAAALLDLHERAHRSLQGLLQHCQQLRCDERERELPGFGYPSIHQQLEHMIGAEEYWVNVVRGSYTTDADETHCPTVEALAVYRARVAQATDEYLRRASAEELNTAREMWTWPGRMRPLVPAHVVMRTLTHLYQHQGQVLAMCRLLDRPGPGNLDFPLD